MPANKLIPNIDAVLGAGIEKLVELRPKAFKHVNLGQGRWAHLFAGWRAQGNLVARRFGDEVVATRLFSSGQALRELCASEFDTVFSTDPTTAVGEVWMVRFNGPAGVIRKGSQFFKEAQPDAQPLAIESARYVVTRDILVSKNQHVVVVPIAAVRPGPTGNTPSGKKFVYNGKPFLTDSELIQPANKQAIFDSTFEVFDCRTAGGSQNPSTDQVLRRAATARASGRFGPTAGAIIAGALSFSGVARLAVIDNENTGKTVIFPVDEAWACSQELNSQVGQIIKDSWNGFGCAVQMGTTGNQFIHIEATVVLSDSRHLIDSTAIEQDIRDALQFYFNERPDWWTWKLETIKAAIAGSNRKIFACTDVKVTDATDSTVVDEPSFLDIDDSFPIIQHYYLNDNATNLTFVGPS